MRNRARIRPWVPAVACFVALLTGPGLGRAQAATSTKGIVVIETTLGYAGARAAGTGMVLTSTGEILTNNHVIRGGAAVKIVVPGSRRSYPPRVLG